MSMVQKLELNWIGKHDPKNKISPEPRILVENPEYSYSNSEAIVNEQLSFGEENKNKVYFDNMLIHGDNLLALKSLELEYAGKIKCIYIDPPYNTGSAFEHYDDNLEHSTWLNLMKPRLELLKMLLSDDGSIWISIDDHEQAYLKVLCDEVFGKNNFIACLPTIMNLKGNQDQFGFAGTHEYTLVYSRDNTKLKINNFKIEDETISEWNQDEYGYFKKGANLKATGINAPREKRPNLFFPIYVNESGNISLQPINGYKKILPITDNQEMSWRWSKQKIENEKHNIIVLNVNGKVSLYKKQRPELGELPSKKPKSLLYKPEYSSGNGTTQIKKIFGNKSFDYVKPEHLIRDFIHLSTKPGDLVLDSFLGSGTTAAVAHKMGRRWIGIELGNHAYTHCYKRLKAVVDGEQGGISKDLNWKGGGGFKFYELAPSLIEKDKFGNPVISDKYTGEMLAEAIAKHKGYYYQPNTEFFWKQSKNGDKNFLYVTENHITPQDLDYIHTLMKQDEHLLICAPSYENECSNQFPNITIQQIPKVLFGKCDFMKEGYSLNVNQNENSEEDNCNE